MATHTCPDGHTSDTADFCSQCGIEMAPSPASAPAPSTSAAAAAKSGGTGEKCPKCSTERDDTTSVFCGVCGYNFATKTGGGQVAPDHDPVANATAPAASTGGSTGSKGSLIDVEVTFTDDARKADAPLKFSIFDEQSIVGRKKSTATPGLAVAIEDAAISTRHLLIDYRAGAVIVRDNNSANGTKINGKDLTSGAEQTVNVGDEIGIGEFTIIKVVAIRQS